jgi:hypothetical protein
MGRKEFRAITTDEFETQTRAKSPISVRSPWNIFIRVVRFRTHQVATCLGNSSPLRTNAIDGLNSPLWFVVSQDVSVSDWKSNMKAIEVHIDRRSLLLQLECSFVSIRSLCDLRSSNNAELEDWVIVIVKVPSTDKKLPNSERIFEANRYEHEREKCILEMSDVILREVSNLIE